MLFWTGKGILPIIILALSAGVTQSCYEIFAGVKLPDQDADLMWGISMGMAALGNLLLVRHLARKPKRVLVDQQTGQEVIMDDTGSLWFIPTRYFTHIFAAGSVICLVRFFLGMD